MEEQGTWASQKHSEAGYGRPVDTGVWTAKTVKRPRQQPAHPQYANYWALLTRKRHTMPHSSQPQHTTYWAPRTRKRHQQEHRPQRPTERSNPTQHAKGRTGDCPGPRKGTTTRGNVTQGNGVGHGEGVSLCMTKHRDGCLYVRINPFPGKQVKRLRIFQAVLSPALSRSSARSFLLVCYLCWGMRPKRVVVGCKGHTHNCLSACRETGMFPYPLQD